MLEIFWSCLIGGTAFALLSLLGGRSVHRAHGLHHSLRFKAGRLLHPTTIVSTITSFGGAGVLLYRYSSLTGGTLIAVAVVIALLCAVAIHFGYVRPMSNSETSIAFSIRDYVGRTGLVTLPISAEGQGQVMIKMGAGNTCEPAASFDGEAIPSGTTIVVVETDDHKLYVSKLDS